MQYFVGVDIGGSYIKAGLVLNGKIVKKAEIPTGAKMGKKIIIENIISAIEKVSSCKKISGIGIGCPGIIDDKRGIIIKTPNLPLEKVRVSDILKKRFRTKVALGKDASCFALAEAVYGAGRNYGTVVGMTLGTGVGCGIAINKKSFHGRGNASEAGHSIINFNGPKDCVNISGSIEYYCGLKGMMRLCREFGLKAKNPKELYNSAIKGDKNARKVFGEYGHYLGIGLSNITNIIDADVIILGGQVSNSWRFFRSSIKKAMNENSFLKKTKILKAQLADSGIIGASIIIK